MLCLRGRGVGLRTRASTAQRVTERTLTAMTPLLCWLMTMQASTASSIVVCRRPAGRLRAVSCVTPVTWHHRRQLMPPPLDTVSFGLAVLLLRGSDVADASMADILAACPQPPARGPEGRAALCWPVESVGLAMNYLVGQDRRVGRGKEPSGTLLCSHCFTDRSRRCF